MESAQLLSSTGEMMSFIYNRLQQTNNWGALYTLRAINKAYLKKVERQIKTAKIDFRCMEQFAASNFITGIKHLKVCMRVWQGSFDALKYLSAAYLPNAQSISAKIYPNFILGFDQQAIELKTHEPLIFQNLNITCEDDGYEVDFWITGNFDIAIRGCEFIGLQLICVENASVLVTGSKFKKCRDGLIILRSDSVYIDEVIMEKCYNYGLRVHFKLSNAVIKDCQTGISVCGPCRGEIQKANITGCKRDGIFLNLSAKVSYSSVEFGDNGQNLRIHENNT